MDANFEINIIFHTACVYNKLNSVVSGRATVCITVKRFCTYKL